MQTAQVPVFEPESTWRIGLADTIGSAYQGCSTTAEQWKGWSLPIRLAPGTYKLSQFHAAIAYCTSDRCDAIYVGIMRRYADGVTPVTLDNGNVWIDVTSQQPSSTSTSIVDFDLGDVEVTLEEGESYYIAMALHKPEGVANGEPGIRTLGTDETGSGETSYIINPATFPTTIPSVWSSVGAYIPEFGLTVKTNLCIVYEGSYSAADAYYLPRRTDGGHYWVKLENAVVEAGNALTMKLMYDNSGSAGTRDTLSLDMGATDQISFNGTDVALNASTAEAGDTFDIGLSMKPSTSKANVFWINKSTGQGPEGDADFATFCHTTKDSGTRYQDYDLDEEVNWVELSGTATAEKVQVGRDMCVFFGDSQVARLYAIKDSFTAPRMWWNAGISGNRFTASVTDSHTAGFLRFKSSTAGQGDLCDMAGILFVFAGMGVNDVNAYVNSDGDRNENGAFFGLRLSSLLYDITYRQDVTFNSILVLGLPPYSSEDADAWEAAFIRDQLNALIEALAISCRCAFYGPYYDVLSGDPDEDVPVFSSSYSADGVHYNTAGVAKIAPKVVAAVEDGLVKDTYDAGKDYLDIERIQRYTAGVSDAINSNVVDALATFGSDMEDLFTKYGASVHDKQGMRDQVLNLARWLEATLR